MIIEEKSCKKKPKETSMETKNFPAMHDYCICVAILYIVVQFSEDESA